jgi:hypothetical protein
MTSDPDSDTIDKIAGSLYLYRNGKRKNMFVH